MPWIAKDIWNFDGSASERRNKDALPRIGIVARGNVTDIAFRHGDVESTGPSLDHANTASRRRNLDNHRRFGICQLSDIMATAVTYGSPTRGSRSAQNSTRTLHTFGDAVSAPPGAIACVGRADDVIQ